MSEPARRLGVVESDVCSKVAYSNFKCASLAARLDRNAFRMRMRPYKCPACFWWHLSSESFGWKGKRR